MQDKNRLKKSGAGMMGLKHLLHTWEQFKEKIEHAAEEGEEFLVWSKAAHPLELILATAAAVLGGAAQDALSFIPGLGVIISAVGILMGPFDEMAFGAPPVIALLEIARRWWGWNIINWAQGKLSQLPTWALVSAFAVITAILTAGDISMNVPLIGLMVWPGELIDQYVFGLPSLLVAIELNYRIGSKVPKVVIDSTSRSGE